MRAFCPSSTTRSSMRPSTPSPHILPQTASALRRCGRCRAPPRLENTLCRVGLEALRGASDVATFARLLHVNHRRERQQQPRTSGSDRASPRVSGKPPSACQTPAHSTQQAVTRNRTLPAVPHIALHESRALPAVVRRRPRPRQRAGRRRVPHRPPQRRHPSNAARWSPHLRAPPHSSVTCSTQRPDRARPIQ